MFPQNIGLLIIKKTWKNAWMNTPCENANSNRLYDLAKFAKILSGEDSSFYDSSGENYFSF